MACMEHECRNCGHVEFNNRPTGGKCPKCGGADWRSFWDEADDHRHDAAESRREER